MKGNRHMKTVNNTKSAQRRHFPSLALLLAAVTLLAFAPQPARAGPSYPFNARFISEFEFVVEPPYVHYTVNCQGRATYMGPTTAVSTDQMVSMIDRSATATYTLTPDTAGVRADTLILTMTFQVTDGPGGITFTGNYTVAEGPVASLRRREAALWRDRRTSSGQQTLASARSPFQAESPSDRGTETDKN